MLLFMIPLLLMSSGVNSQGNYYGPRKSAASESQIRFAIENKYDQTGPGAKGREFAYATYKTLEDALVAYLDDPDTKLPKHERAKAEMKLIGSQKQSHPTHHLLHKDEPIFINAPAYNDIKNLYNTDVNIQAIHPNEHRYHFGYVKNVELEKQKDPFRFHKLQSVKGSPLNLAHFTRDPMPEIKKEEFNPNPQYTFSYGVHDKLTGDSKSAHETRNGGVVRGFYTFRDADGKQRTVEYTADDKLGFRAIVRRTASNGQ
ncbi:hypothetical protein ABMA27_001744 [Loxostege sticticalis]|uniref:Uncharacterized protein n=1 Tax=Loxostege sticticalis TaxID=481309 RepID=A0ABR3HZJ8_LOXSC